MRGRVVATVALLLAVVVGVAVWAAFLRPGPQRTEVLSWSPLDSAGTIKGGLTVKDVTSVGHCEGGPASEAIPFAFRCGAGNDLYDPCWRDGPGRTNSVICVAAPWSLTTYRLQVPDLMLAAGVNFGGPGDYPWAIELTDGNRCLLAQGAHDSLPRSEGGLVVDFNCVRDGVVLLRDLHQRGRAWTIGAARYASNHYTRLGEVRVRRAYLGGLPKRMESQNKAAEAAASAAEKIASQRQPRQRFSALRVRLALPEANWASVFMLKQPGSLSSFSATFVVHRVGRSWSATTQYQPYCDKLQANVRNQLFPEAACPRS